MFFIAAIYLNVVVSLVGLALSIAGMVQKGKSKGLAIAGLVISCITLILSIYMSILVPQVMDIFGLDMFYEFSNGFDYGGGYDFNDFNLDNFNLDDFNFEFSY